MASALFLPKYTESHALVIGINKYRHANPLLHACNDAEEVANVLIKRLGFSASNVTLLVNQDATRESILRAYLGFCESTDVDDRVLVFFAGHGHTVSGRRGETGFLVPVDGETSNLASLIRWDELTRSADLVPAKHMLFLMDACYGGLALTRTTIPPGRMRFLKDMLQRYSRQVLTAGKPDEAVSDSGGTRSGHSIFTSHLLDGLEGAAAPPGGILTGHGVMAYVYDNVGSDSISVQTPHFGFIDGDGDFIFDTSLLSELESKADSEPQSDLDAFIMAPSTVLPATSHDETVAETLKRLLANPSDRIRQHDYISELIRRAAEKLNPGRFPTHDTITKEEFATRLQAYEDAISDVLIASILLAHWGEREQLNLLRKILERLAELDKPRSGTVLWLNLHWYPILLLMYAAGISALAGARYDSLHAALLTPVHAGGLRYEGLETPPIQLPVISELSEIAESFKMLPDMERRYVPRSDYVHKRLQPILEDQLFLGRSYDSLFDQFEIFLALSYIDLRDEDPKQHIWGPPGRFVWKERGRSSEPVYTRFVNMAKAKGNDWEPLKVGFFRSSPDRFSEVADAYGERLKQVNWW